MVKKIPLILISIAGVVVVAGGVVAGLTAFVGNDSKTAETSNATKPVNNDLVETDPAKQELNTTPDLSKDLGACTTVTKASVVSAIGSSVVLVGEPTNRGYGKEGVGTGSQSCTFALSDKDAINDRLSVSVTVFENDETLAVSKQAYVDAEKIQNIGEVAYFQTNSTPASSVTPAQNDYSIAVFKGMKLYAFTIAQPAEDDAFTSASAKIALTSISTSAKLEN